MVEKGLQEVTVSLRNNFNKAVKNSLRMSVDDGIQLYKVLIQQDPAFKDARERLRDLELKKTTAMGKVGRTMAMLTTFPTVMKAQGKIAKDPVAALSLAEDALAKCLDNMPALKVLAAAGSAAGALFVSIQAMTIALNFHDSDDAALRLLAGYYLENGQPNEGAAVYEKLVAKHPNSAEVRSLLREALAAASIERGTGNGDGEANSGVQTRDSEEARAQQLMEGTIHDAAQAQMVIERFEKMLAEKESADIRRRLAEAYIVAGKYDEAIQNLELVAQNLGGSDAALDKNIERAYLGKYDDAIKTLKANPEAYENAEQQIADLVKQRNDFQLERTKARSEKYPNDLQLHYDLALLEFDNNMIDEALEQFQLARRHPQRKIVAQYYLGRCFAAKGLTDMALEQLQGAIDQMEVMDEVKENAIYYLGRTFEDAGNKEKALENYKTLYQSDISFMDVAARIESLYQKQA